MKKYGVWMCALALSVLAACGGGGSSTPDQVNKQNDNGNLVDNGSPGGSPNPVTLSITAAKGLAMVGATITVTDANLTSSTCSGTTDKDGKLSCTLPAGFTAPFVIVAQLDDEKQYSVIPTGGSSSVNVTPLTTVVVAGLSPSGDPAQFASEVKADKTKASADAIKTQVTELNTNLRAVIDVTVGSGTQVDPLAGSLQANTGTGQDKLLDTVKVSITAPDTANGVAAKQVISLKADPDAMVTISKGNADPKPEPISSSKVAATEDVTKVNPAVLVADLMTRMNACYALPVADRVSKADLTAIAADVKATACKDLFVGNDPAKFKNGGVVVSAKGAFKSLFSSLADGVVFDRGNLEYVVRNQGAANNGYWVVSYRSTDKGKNISYGNFALKIENGVLKQAGNQYDHDVTVSSFVQDREFINDPAASYLSTGYALSVTDKTANGASIYKQVTVTTPKGKTLDLKPTAGCSLLGLVLPNGKVNCTSFVRLNYGYKDVSKTDDIPAKERDYLFFVPLQSKFTDADLAAIPDQGTWKFEIEFADANKPKVTQMHRTLSRAPTLGELRKTVFADLTSSAKADVVSNTKAAGAYVFGQNDYVQLGGNPDDFWTVPNGAVAPTNIRIFGRAPTVNQVRGNQFDDAATVLASARSALIKCSRLSIDDKHCESSVLVGASGFYATGASATDLQLHANLPGNSTRSKHFAFYYPNPNPNPKTLADFAGTYNITAVWQARGGDGTESGTSNGTVQINASGTVAACSVGDFIQCSGGFTLNANKDGVTFSIPASGETISGTLSGTVNSTYVLSGSLSGKDTDDGSTLTGTLTGRRQ
jgi:hypothetical protein